MHVTNYGNAHNSEKLKQRIETEEKNTFIKKEMCQINVNHSKCGCKSCHIIDDSYWH